MSTMNFDYLDLNFQLQNSTEVDETHQSIETQQLSWTPEWFDNEYLKTLEPVFTLDNFSQDCDVVQPLQSQTDIQPDQLFNLTLVGYTQQPEQPLKEYSEQLFYYLPLENAEATTGLETIEFKECVLTDQLMENAETDATNQSLVPLDYFSTKLAPETVSTVKPIKGQRKKAIAVRRNPKKQSCLVGAHQSENKQLFLRKSSVIKPHQTRNDNENVPKEERLEKERIKKKENAQRNRKKKKALLMSRREEMLNVAWKLLRLEKILAKNLEKEKELIEEEKYLISVEEGDAYLAALTKKVMMIPGIEFIGSSFFHDSSNGK